MLKMYVYKEFNEVHNRLCYMAYYPIHMQGYIRITLHDNHVNNVLRNLCKTKKYLIKVAMPSQELINSVNSKA